MFTLSILDPNSLAIVGRVSTEAVTDHFHIQLICGIMQNKIVTSEKRSETNVERRRSEAVISGLSVF